MRYAITNVAQPGRIVNVSNVFGKQSMFVGSAVFLLVPAEKNVPVDHDAPSGLDHFLCYSAFSNTVAPQPTVGLLDQFNTDTGVTIAIGVLFCTPVEKDHGGVITPIESPRAHLVCYDANAGVAATTIAVETDDQFSSDDFDVKLDSFNLCVPSRLGKVELQNP